MSSTRAPQRIPSIVSHSLDAKGTRLVELMFCVDMGEGVPSALRDFIDHHRDHASFLRAQLGTGSSFIAWTKRQWACEAIPASLERLLQNISHQDSYTPTKGSFMLGPPISFAFHENGSYFVSGYNETARGSYYQRVPYHLKEFSSETLCTALTQLFPSGMVAKKDIDDLAVSVYGKIKSATKADCL